VRQGEHHPRRAERRNRDSIGNAAPDPTSINAELAGTPNGLANSDQIHDLKIDGNRVRFDVETNALDDVLRQLRRSACAA
jgi:hypothetical protein